MTIKAFQTQSYRSKCLQYLVVILLILGVFLRFTNLDQKTLWFDETYTPLQSSGYTEKEVFNHFSGTGIITSSDLQQYLHPAPNGSLIDTIRSFAVEDPQHTPLYYLMTRVWIQCFGNSVTALRSLPAAISLLTFPCIYWLCLELFSLPIIGWTAVGLVAIAPLHILYAQEAREYTLWIVMTLASSAALLRALRLKTKLMWGLYSVTVAFSLYAFIFSAFVIVGHGIYVFTLERFRLSTIVRSYLIASLLGLLPFLPWLVIIAANLSQVQATSVTNILDASKSAPELLVLWLRGIRLVFLDLDVGSQTPLLYRLINTTFLAIAPFFVATTFYFLCRNTPRRIWLFVLLLTWVTFLPLAIADLVSGGIRSTVPRYILPFCLGIQLASASFLADQFTKATSAWRQRLWNAVVGVVVCSGIVSCVTFTQAETWWTKGQLDFLGASHVINQAEHPLLIGRASIAELMALSYQLNPSVQLLIQPNCFNCAKTNTQERTLNQLHIPSSFDPIFVFQAHPKEGWLDEFQNGKDYQAMPLLYKNRVLVDYAGSRFWKLVKQKS